MRIPAFTEDRDFGKITNTVTVDLPKQWHDQFDTLTHKVEAMQRDILALRHYVAANRRAIARLINVYTQHSPLFEVAEIYTIYDLAKLNGNDRRSALAKMNKSNYWPQEQAKQLTPEEFKEICEAAKVVTEDDT